MVDTKTTAEGTNGGGSSKLNTKSPKTTSKRSSGFERDPDHFEEEKVEEEPVLHAKYRAYQLPWEENVRIATTPIYSWNKNQTDEQQANVKNASETISNLEKIDEEQPTNAERIVLKFAGDNVFSMSKISSKDSFPFYTNASSWYGGQNILESTSIDIENIYLEDVCPEQKVSSEKSPRKTSYDTQRNQDFCFSHKCLAFTFWCIALFISAFVARWFLAGSDDFVPSLTRATVDMDGGVSWEVLVPLVLFLLEFLFFLSILVISITQRHFRAKGEFISERSPARAHHRK